MNISSLFLYLIAFLFSCASSVPIMHHLYGHKPTSAEIPPFVMEPSIPPSKHLDSVLAATMEVELSPSNEPSLFAASPEPSSSFEFNIMTMEPSMWIEASIMATFGPGEELEMLSQALKPSPSASVIASAMLSNMPKSILSAPAYGSPLPTISLLPSLSPTVAVSASLPTPVHMSPSSSPSKMPSFSSSISATMSPPQPSPSTSMTSSASPSAEELVMASPSSLPSASSSLPMSPSSTNLAPPSLMPTSSPSTSFSASPSTMVTVSSTPSATSSYSKLPSPSSTKSAPPSATPAPPSPSMSWSASPSTPPSLSPSPSFSPSPSKTKPPSPPKTPMNGSCRVYTGDSISIKFGAKDAISHWTYTKGGIEWRRGNPTTKVDPRGMGELCFKIKATRNTPYYFTAITRASHGTEHNDFWVRFSGGMMMRKGKVVKQMAKPRGFFKAYQNYGPGKAADAIFTVDFDSHSLQTMSLKKGLIYDLCMSGRSSKFTVYELILASCKGLNCSPRTARIQDAVKNRETSCA